VQETENVKGKNEMPTKNELMLTKENGTLSTRLARLEGRMSVDRRDSPIVVSQKQFESVETAHRDSVNLLDSCGLALLDAMEMAIPPKDSGRMIGDYAGQNLRKLAKSVCDIVQTKTGVVRSMYSIARDE
jgi:hypothetical protein